jgi:pimeloyl-ACP methyl ester carboxylesterase
MACTWLTLCLLYYQGQWQIVLHPVHTASQSEPANAVRFSPNESGQPQLVGQLLKSSPGSYSNLTVLFLAGGDGSVANSAQTIAALHDLGLNVFAFDYRGYGLSTGPHPNQQRMTADSEATWRYLTTTRGLSASQIVLYGTGVGASLATHLAGQHPEIPALILDSPYTDLLNVAHQNSPRLLPVGLLFKDRFPLIEPLANLRTPKLLIAGSTLPAAYVTAADPKITVDLPTRTDALLDQAVKRFLDQYTQPVPIPAPSLTNPR